MAKYSMLKYLCKGSRSSLRFAPRIRVIKYPERYTFSDGAESVPQLRIKLSKKVCFTFADMHGNSVSQQRTLKIGFLPELSDPVLVANLFRQSLTMLLRFLHAAMSLKMHGL